MANHTLKTLTVSLLVATAVGCTSYPDHGQGGLGEFASASDFSPVMPDEPIGPEHGLRFDFHLTKLHLDSLIQKGAEWCFPAAVVQAKTKENRIVRELEGQMLLDAANDIVIQRKNLAKLENQLDYVRSQASCVPPEHNQAFQNEVAVITELVELLNIDNQFAIDSIEINPKYMGHLAKATTLLNQYPNLNLRVTGHADATGDASYNDQLAKGRADQVKRYLSVFGLAPMRIQTLSVGDTLPLFEGDSAATKLTNRRVSIDVVSTSSNGGAQ
jgi:outer membrane protein OmpA-like peptidoglycan-associated protein